jgi:hypothetical protein
MGDTFYFDRFPNDSKCTNVSCHVRMCATCVDSLKERWIHIGKSCNGWYFAVHIYPRTELYDFGKIRNWEDWKLVLTLNKGIIYKIRNDFRRKHDQPTDDRRLWTSLSKITLEYLTSMVEHRSFNEVQRIENFDPFTKNLLTCGQLIHDTWRNLIFLTDNKKLYGKDTSDSIGSGPWFCFSGVDCF